MVSTTYDLAHAAPNPFNSTVCNPSFSFFYTFNGSVLAFPKHQCRNSYVQLVISKSSKYKIRYTVDNYTDNIRQRDKYNQFTNLSERCL